MKQLIAILMFATIAVSCTKDIQQENVRIVTEPTITITNTRKVFAGSNPSVMVSYTIANADNITNLKLNNILEAPKNEGSNFVNDPNNGQATNVFYFWHITLKDGKIIITNPKQYFF